jgi:hypothetical protein
MKYRAYWLARRGLLLTAIAIGVVAPVAQAKSLKGHLKSAGGVIQDTWDVARGKKKISRHDLKINRHSILPSELEFSRHDIKQVYDAVGVTGTSVWHASGEVLRGAGHEIQRASGEAERFGKKIEAETKRTGKNMEDLVQATGGYVEGTFRDYRDMYSEAVRDALDGKILDAAWDITYKSYKSSDHRLSEAVMRSSYANAIGATFASLVGPEGTAAYSAWYTYKATKDLELALKAGVLAGTMSAASQSVSAMKVSPETRISDASRKAILAGAVSGLGVAAAGGDSNDIGRALGHGALTMAVRDGYEQYTLRNLAADEPPPSLGSYCALSVKRADGKPDCGVEEKYFLRTGDGEVARRPTPDGSLGEPIPDTARIPGDRSWVGLAVADGEHSLFGETSVLMQSASRIPHINPMAIAHDKFVIDLNLRGAMVQLTIPPFLVAAAYASRAGPPQRAMTTMLRKQGASNAAASGRSSADRRFQYDIATELRLKLAKMLTFDPPPLVAKASASATGHADSLLEKALPLSFFCTNDARLVDGARIDPHAQLPIATRSIFVASDATDATSCAVIVQAREEMDADVVAYTSPSSLEACETAAHALANGIRKAGWECQVRGE